jgi:hypothetical protein
MFGKYDRGGWWMRGKNAIPDRAGEAWKSDEIRNRMKFWGASVNLTNGVLGCAGDVFENRRPISKSKSDIAN